MGVWIYDINLNYYLLLQLHSRLAFSYLVNKTHTKSAGNNQAVACINQPIECK